jgi:hypothetical protein
VKKRRFTDALSSKLGATGKREIEMPYYLKKIYLKIKMKF